MKTTDTAFVTNAKKTSDNIMRKSSLISSVNELDCNKKDNVPSGTMTVEVPGRTLIKTREMKILTQDKGIVVVAIIVDKYGRIKSAQPCAEGTNTTRQYLFTKAKQAA